VLDRLHQTSSRDRADDLVYHLPLPDEDEGWDAAHAEARREYPAPIDVDLHDPQAACVVLRELVDDRTDRPAGRSPGRPEVDQHRERCAQDLGLEGGIRDRGRAHPTRIGRGDG
jgi:hypothetical protein